MKKKAYLEEPSSDEEEGQAGWEVVYSGFALILLCFFIMLCSFSSIEEAKVMRFTKSFVEAVSIMSGGLNLEKGEMIISPSADIIEQGKELSAVIEKVKTFAEKIGIDKELSFKVDDAAFTVRMPDKVLFSLGLADLSEHAHPLLDSIASAIKDGDYSVRIEGHTDDLPILTARFPSNWELSTARAVNVLRYLNEKAGIPSHRLSAEGYGQYRPIASNATEKGRARNRRVTIIVERSVEDRPDVPGETWGELESME